ncbi:hypothetical protein OLX02_07935 [Novosphingobium sp. KCTC 2891]|uniref:c-type cytochrome n=1 Tax=Novosphingobium sp. KCTC 2891 TaxID=2989730 RepID=UPI00222346E1|nr:hypothetical protein [Novosphingobium sp. KCTC 2891]MCW1382752.1 hypothetical protein [Novosphingobium sp. KCTC 2891]
MKHALILGAAALAAACSATAAISAEGTAPAPSAAAAAPPAQPSLFAGQIAPLLESNCAVCHLTGSEAGGMALVADQAIGFLVDQPSQEVPGLKRVAPGDPDNSYLVMKLEGTHTDHGGIGAQMPFGGSPLSKEQIALVRQWIKEGAKP